MEDTISETKEISPLSLSLIRLEKAVQSPELGMGYNKYLVSVIGVVSVSIGMDYKS